VEILRWNALNKWDERYSQSTAADAEPHPLVVAHCRSIPPGHALDVACGTGRHAVFLAQHGWTVTAVDYSRVAIDILRQRIEAGRLHIDARVVDLKESHSVISTDTYDLIVICNYLQRDLFPRLRQATQAGGAVIVIVAMVDADPGVKPMNPAFLVQPGELCRTFEDWRILHYRESKPAPGRRAVAELIACNEPRKCADA
jgi:SAM-dependent methyltransferase